MLLIYIGYEEYVGKSIQEVIEIENLPEKQIKEIQICGDRGSRKGYPVLREYIIRSGDIVIGFKGLEP